MTSGKRAGQDVPDPVMRSRRKQPRAVQVWCELPVRAGRQSPQLKVRPRGDLDQAVTERAGRDERLQLFCADAAARDSDSSQPSVGSLVQAHTSRTAIGARPPPGRADGHSVAPDNARRRGSTRWPVITRWAVAPNTSATMVQITACMPTDASRKRHRV